MIASMATFHLPMPNKIVSFDYKSVAPLQETLFRKYNIEIPLWYWSFPNSQLIRISVQLYNSMEQYRYFAEALRETLKD
jgi:isopenicillin-N epimerase